MRMVSVLAAFCAVTIQAASAVEISQKGAMATLSGPINNGDEFLLRDFLTSPQGGQVKFIHLNSQGGRVLAAREMARHIRRAGLVTVVDASRALCNSACTALFTAGVRRHYLNATFADGAGGRGGLGFHEGNSLQASGARGYSGGAVAEMNNIYYEMGVPGAASLTTKAAFDRLYRISGQTALSLGIASSLSPP
ncbi:hypothetical protein CYD53_111181 [Bosea psychrotolerans]|uniref:Uncharacterized protein n=1 Tax=Bosea psychrotolerans TaxID=1871628 RepID=A0A2S4M4P6_9HYPH|nr:hypothetical protein CYD53_111181 [Bosea psychrotolerans]